MSQDDQAKRFESFSAEIAVTRLDRSGWGVGETQGKPVVIRGALSGERVRARVLGGGQHRFHGEVEEVLEPYKGRVEPRCALVDSCGGCPIQHLGLLDQRRWKHSTLKSALRHVAYKRTRFAPLVAVGEPYGFRAKLQLMAGETEKGELCLGLYRAHSHELVEIEHCVVQDEVTDRVASACLSALRANGVDSKWLRSLLVRSNGAEALVTLIIHPGVDGPPRKPLSTSLLEIDAVVGVAINVSPEGGNALLGGQTRHQAGRKRLRYTVGDVAFEAGPVSFVQTHLGGMGRLVDAARELLPNELEGLFDLYAGAGLFSLALAERCERVVAVERAGPSAEDGQHNFKRLGHANARFVSGSVEEFVASAERCGERDAVIVDPPRSGLTEQVTQGLLEKMAPRRIVYVSCNPAALARDAALFVAAGYQLSAVRSFDLFTHTPHLEVVALLEKVN